MMLPFHNIRLYLLYLRVIFGMLVAGIVMAAVCFIVIKNMVTIPSPAAKVVYLLELLGPVLSVGFILLSVYTYRKLLVQKIKPEDGLSRKLSLYLIIILIKYIITAAAALFPLTVYLITDNTYLLIFTFIGLVEIIRFVPSTTRIQSALRLDAAERAALQNPDHPI